MSPKLETNHEKRNKYFERDMNLAFARKHTGNPFIYKH